MHTKEPWYVSIDLDSSAVAIVDNLGIFSEHGTTGLPETDAKRIVACVNACAGVPIEVLEMTGATMVPPEEPYSLVKQQRDDLLAALKLARAEFDKLPHSLGYTFDHIPAIDAAIAKADLTQ